MHAVWVAIPKRSAASSSHEQPPPKVPTLRPFASQQLVPFQTQDLSHVMHEGVVLLDLGSPSSPSVVHSMTLERVRLDPNRQWTLVFDDGMGAVVCDDLPPVLLEDRFRRTLFSSPTDGLVVQEKGERRGTSDGGARLRK